MLPEYVVLDLETTGLSKHYHKITEIGAVKVRDNKIIERFEQLVNPEVLIPSFITGLTGIDNEMVKDMPTIGEVLPSFIDFVGNDIIVGHNIGFDYGFINESIFRHMDTYLFNERLCTIKLAKRLIPDLTTRKLSALCNYFEIDNPNAHRAMADVISTNRVFMRFQAMLHNNGITELEDILKFQKAPVPKINYMPQIKREY